MYSPCWRVSCRMKLHCEFTQFVEGCTSCSENLTNLNQHTACISYSKISETNHFPWIINSSLSTHANLNTFISVNELQRCHVLTTIEEFGHLRHSDMVNNFSFWKHFEQVVFFHLLLVDITTFCGFSHLCWLLVYCKNGGLVGTPAAEKR
jgi:hypothetical protein